MKLFAEIHKGHFDVYFRVKYEEKKYTFANRDRVADGADDLSLMKFLQSRPVAKEAAAAANFLMAIII